jgi:hypothetical protein
VARADSITWDPHKQMGVPIPSSLLFLQNGADFRRMAIFSDYFNRPGESKPNPGEHLDTLQKFLYDKMLAEARRSVSFTRIRDRVALRFLILTPGQTVAEIVKTLDY